MHPSFLGEFADAFLAGTGLEGGSIPVAVAGFQLAYSRMLTNQLETLRACGLTDVELDKLSNIDVVLSEAHILSGKFGLAMKNSSNLVNFIGRKLKPRLDGLKEGEIMLVPGAITPNVRSLPYNMFSYILFSRLIYQAVL